MIMMLTHNKMKSIMTMTKIRSKIPIAQHCRLSEKKKDKEGIDKNSDNL